MFLWEIDFDCPIDDSTSGEAIIVVAATAADAVQRFRVLADQMVVGGREDADWKHGDDVITDDEYADEIVRLKTVEEFLELVATVIEKDEFFGDPNLFQRANAPFGDGTVSVIKRPTPTAFVAGGVVEDQ